jgi:RNA polymerase sigma-70 factor (ECF subfamily)
MLAGIGPHALRITTHHGSPITQSARDGPMTDPFKQVTAEFLAHRHQLMSFIHGLLRDPQEAEDIFQEVWLKLAGALEKGVEIENQAKWCRKAAKYLILQHWRDQRTAKVFADSTLIEFLDFVDQAYDENESLHDLRPERQRALNECLRALPEKSKRLLALKYEQSCALKEIAAQVQQTTDAVIKALLRLRQALAVCVQKKLKLQELGL